MSCKKCSAEILPGEEKVICEGFCSNSFHAECVGLTVDELISCNNNKHIWWMCTACGSMMHDIREETSFLDKRKTYEENNEADNGTEVKLSDQLNELKRQVADIRETLADITRSRDIAPNSADKDFSFENTSPLSSTKLNQGSRCVTKSNTKRVDVAAEKFWLFLTRIKNNADEQAVTKMVADSIGTTKPIIVKRLVPSWKDVSTMPYVSYKVGIDEEFKQKALLASTWPRGILFREFQQQFILWEPDR